MITIILIYFKFCYFSNKHQSMQDGIRTLEAVYGNVADKLRANFKKMHPLLELIMVCASPQNSHACNHHLIHAWSARSLQDNHVGIRSAMIPAPPYHPTHALCTSSPAPSCSHADRCHRWSTSTAEF